jgi:hypothetical protein
MRNSFWMECESESQNWVFLVIFHLVASWFSKNWFLVQSLTLTYKTSTIYPTKAYLISINYQFPINFTN